MWTHCGILFIVGKGSSKSIRILIRLLTREEATFESPHFRSVQFFFRVNYIKNGEEHNKSVTSVLQGGRMFGTPGAGGNMVYGDLEHKLGLAFLTNKLYSGLNPISPQYRRLLEATYHVLQNIKW